MTVLQGIRQPGVSSDGLHTLQANIQRIHTLTPSTQSHGPHPVLSRAASPPERRRSRSARRDLTHKPSFVINVVRNVNLIYVESIASNYTGAQRAGSRMGDRNGEPPPAVRHQCQDHDTGRPPEPRGWELRRTDIQIQIGVSTVSSMKNMLTSAEGSRRGPAGQQHGGKRNGDQPVEAEPEPGGNAEGAECCKERGGHDPKKISAIRAEARLPIARLVATFLPVARMMVKVAGRAEGGDQRQPIADQWPRVDALRGDEGGTAGRRRWSRPRCSAWTLSPSTTCDRVAAITGVSAMMNTTLAASVCTTAPM